MAIISEEHGFLFVQAPRTGCTAIADGVLVAHFGGRKLPPRTVLDSRGHVAVGSKHAAVDELVRHGLVAPEQVDRLLVFTTVRNPFDSLVSGYLKRVGQLQELRDQPESWVHQRPGMVDELRFAGEHSFGEWLDYKLRRRSPRTLWRTRPHQPRHMYARWIEGAGQVMRFERLQEDLDEVLGRLGLPPVEIPRINVTENRNDTDYRRWYEDRSRALVESVFRPDLERFGYRF